MARAPQSALLALLLFSFSPNCRGTSTTEEDDGICFGCWNTEDEECFPGKLTQTECFQIYGHREWLERCPCDQVGTGEGDVSLYFSIPAFIVLFRESLEVVIVLAIIVQFLVKSRDEGSIDDAQFFAFRREVYIGASIGFLCCLAFGVGFLVLASFLYELFEGDSLLLFEAVMMGVTSLVLSFMALNFYKMIISKEAHERKMRQRVQETVEAQRASNDDKGASFGRKHAFFVLAFCTGLREGLESILFLVAVVADVDDLSALPLPIICALILARICGCCFFAGTKRMPVDWFMRASSILLLFIAAGFFMSATHNIQELDAFGCWSPKACRPWQNSRLWDLSECCSDKTNRVFVLFRALLGYQDQPTPVEFFGYAVYWIVVVAIGVFMVRRANRDIAAKRQQWRVEDAANTSQQNAQEGQAAAPEGAPADS